ncbi:hypothetical protein LTS08_001387 [Lithohypha guttulata]|nr:hypothetical protein LTS08_001387 [Lithohypha guttulata]
MRSTNTINGLKRWSSKPKHLPDIDTVKNIHVYDFDNTLFSSPLPNPQLWHPSTIGLLQAYEVFAHGGWWHNPDILAATGEGIEVEEPRAWNGWWNEVIVQLVESSMQEKGTLTVLLTGRGETNFAELVNRMANSKQLDFDMVVLKPEVGPNQQQFSSTMDFKQAYLRDLVLTYRFADNIRIYEDRVKHVKGFRDFMERFNKSFLAQVVDPALAERSTTCTAEVIHVCELKCALDPQTEIMAVQKAINQHNRVIKSGAPNPTRALEKFYRIHEQFLYFGYLINQTDSARLITLCNASAHLIDSGEVKYMASSILIVPYYPRKDILEKVGGRGTKITWQVTGVAKFEDRIWAARVAPISDKPIYTQDETPMVILAIRKGSRQIDANRIKNWQPPSEDKKYIFETVAEDKVMLKLEELDENAAVDERNHRVRLPRNVNSKRKFQDEADPNRENQNGQQGSPSWASVAQNNRHNQNQQASGNRHFNKPKNNFNKSRSHQQFNNNSNPTVNPNAVPTQPQNLANTRRQRGGNGGRGGRNGGFAGYKSLDDYNGGGFDGANDPPNNNAAAAASGAMMMDY